MPAFFITSTWTCIRRRRCARFSSMPELASTATLPMSAEHGQAPGDPFADLISSMDAMQQRLCAEARRGVSYVALNELAHRLLAQVLAEHGITRSTPGECFDRGVTRTFLPHGLGHLLGLQVHDAAGHQATPSGTSNAPPDEHPFLRLTRTLEPGFVVTVEPGLYFIPALLEELRNGPASRLVNWDRVERFLPYGGIRVEDNVLVTETESRNLSRPALLQAGSFVRPRAIAATPGAASIYSCPMHPEVELGHAASCPKCGMALELASPPAPATQTDWICPMHADVAENVSGSCPICGMALEPRTISIGDGENAELADMSRRFRFAALLTVPLPDRCDGRSVAGTARLGTPVPRARAHCSSLRWQPRSACGWPGRSMHAPLPRSRNRSLNMFTLISLGVGVAYGYSVIATLLPRDIPGLVPRRSGRGRRLLRGRRRHRHADPARSGT